MDIDDGSRGDNGEAPVEQQQEESSPPPAVHSTARMPPAGSGARLGFLLGVQPSPSSSKVGGARGGLPPTAATGSGRKRGRATRAAVASSSDGDSQVQKKAKNRAAGDKQAQKDKSLVGTSPSSQAAQTPSESVNEISDDEDEVEEVNAAAATRAATRRLTSDEWLEMKKEFVGGEWKGICNYYHKGLSAKSKSGTSHLRDHLIVLDDYPLSIVDNAGFRRFVGALQPLFHLHTRNTIRKDIIGRHDKEKSKAIEYMTMLQSRIAVTADMWTADSQKKGYMAVTGHFVDESWKLRSILMGVYICASTTYRRCHS